MAVLYHSDSSGRVGEVEVRVSCRRRGGRCFILTMRLGAHAWDVSTLCQSCIAPLHRSICKSCCYGRVAFFVSSAPFSPSIALRPHHIQDRLKGELDQLVIDIWRIGDPEKPEVLFGELFDDDEVQNYYEALVGTLKAAKKRECTLLPPQSRSHLGSIPYSTSSLYCFVLQGVLSSTKARCFSKGHMIK